MSTDRCSMTSCHVIAKSGSSEWGYSNAQVPSVPSSATSRVARTSSLGFASARVVEKDVEAPSRCPEVSRQYVTRCRRRSPSAFASPWRAILQHILLGAQSAMVGDMSWPYYHQQFIHVDTDGNLYCSMTDTKKIVARNLQRERWYHVVLTYETEEPSGRRVQSVYLDGQLVQTSYGSLHHEWYQVSHWQFGSGCISGGAQGAPTPRYCGWYGFNGLINSPRIWTHALSPDEIQRLDDITTKKDAYGFVSWLASLYSNVKRVRCSLPAEGAVQVYGHGSQVTGDVASDQLDAGMIGTKIHASSKQDLTLRPVREQTSPIYSSAPIELFDSGTPLDLNTRASKRRRMM